MLDFVSIKSTVQKSTLIIYPEFIVKRSRDLMIRGKAFYAVWDEEVGLWSKNEDDVQRMVDNAVLKVASETETNLKKEVKLLREFSSNKWSEWQKYCKSLPDNYNELDENLIFSNQKVKKTDYVSRILPYPIEQSDISSYDELMSTLYDPEERRKLEWAIGAIMSGDSKWIQKFIVLYGPPGSGKSTFLNLIENMFQGYCAVFESKALGSATNSFALEAFRENPLIAIQHDGDLSRIEDNTRINSIVSHEKLVVNEKFKATYTSRFKTFLFMGTNKPVRITDAKSGILRRLIDVSPSGNKIPRKRFNEIQARLPFEFSGIAYHCLKEYENLGPSFYDDYTPVSMMGATNDFYNFILDNYEFFTIDSVDEVSLNTAWMRYKDYCEDAKVSYPLPKRLFKEEMKNYFSEFHDRYQNRRSVYRGFLKERFEYSPDEKKEELVIDMDDGWLRFNQTTSEFDDIFKDCPAQYSNEEGKPLQAWDRVKTKLSDIDTNRLHYVRVPLNLIVIDFDIPGDDGEKNFDRNLKEAEKWPQTYAELSKSGSGIHLHYFYDGDPESLKRIYDKNVEIKVFTGKSSLRRMLTKCNNFPIATIRSGLPKKEVKRVVKSETVQSERGLRELILRNLRKEIHPATKPSIDFIYKILEDAYESGLKYDVTDLRPAVQQFAMNSSHQSDYCLRLLCRMKFCSEEPSEDTGNYAKDAPIVIFDIEVFPNLFVVCWKKKGPGWKKVGRRWVRPDNDSECMKWINPTAEQIEELVKTCRLVGFNVRKYDNHIMWARMMGYNNEQLFHLSQKIINDKEGFFGEAYNLSYTDIYDFLSPQNKMGLKKWEIKLKIHHQELGLPWDQPVPEEKWEMVADYCCNDVLSSEATWDVNQEDWMVREILADWSGLTVNDTTNSHAKRIIVGRDRNPQNQFVYTDLSKEFPGYRFDKFGISKEEYIEGTKIVQGKSIYRGEDPSEGGYVFAMPGIYTNVALLDITSMHPSSIIILNLFGDTYTMRFRDIKEARILIKHKDFEGAKKILPEKLHKYLKDPSSAKKLAAGLKGVINPVYGLTSAKFPNELRDPRNEDNIVAKRGALFMINLKHEVQDRGYTVVHIKTDSIKIADADPEIIQFVMDYGKQYGYDFEHEDTYSKICLVNDAVYIARYAEPHQDDEGNYIWWTATGEQFQVPYVFKKLFSHEAIEFDDFCEVKSVSTAIYLDFNEDLKDVSEEEYRLKKLEKDYREGKISDILFEEECKNLESLIAEGHDYRFVGKVGAFCPVKDGEGGGVLLRQGNNGKYSAVEGTKKPNKKDTYRFMETEMARLKGEDCVDLRYYDQLVDDAIDAISKYGDFEWFASDDIVPLKENFPMNYPEVE